MTMASWQPDWNTLNSVAAAFLQSTPLAAKITSVTPPGSYVATGLQLDLGAILAAAPSGGTLVIAVDTLNVPSGTTAIPAIGVEIIARSVQVAGGGSATLNVTGADASLQLVTAEIVGGLSVAFGGGQATPLALSGVASPQVLTVEASTPTKVVIATDGVSIADVMHSPWSVLSLQLTSAIAGVVADQEGSGPLALAESMLRWVIANGKALIANQASFSTVDYTDVASMLTAAAAALTATQTAASGATYVPILSAELYQTQVKGVLGLAQIYDSKISALQSQSTVTQELATFATTLGNINQQAAGPLIATLQNLVNETGLLEGQLRDSALQLQQITETLPDLQKALTEAINDKFQEELVSTAIDTLFTLATLYIGAAVAVIGDPEVLAGKGQAILKSALEYTKSVIEAGKEPLSGLINDGVKGGDGQPSTAASNAAMHGGQVLATSVASFGEALNTLWAAVGVAIADAPGQIDFSPDFLSKLEKAPDISDFTTGGVDPVTYWNVVVNQTEAAVQPYISKFGQATAYLSAVKLAATYGSAIGDLQMKLLDLYNQGIATFARLQAIYQAQAQWTQLQGALSQQGNQAQAAIGLLQRGYLDVKRALVSAVNDYRAAFFYQWLQNSGISVDVSMDYLTLSLQAQKSINDLQNVLSGTSDGHVLPRQAFKAVTYQVTRGDAPLFTEVDGLGQAQWSIDAGDSELASQFDGNTALYLDEATFVLEGAQQTGEVELVVTTSGRYQSKLGANTFRFVSQAVSMNNFYNPSPRPRFITSWKFADPAAYMMPTPFTNWTLTVKKGNWQDMTGITMTLWGKYLQNPSGTSNAN